MKARYFETHFFTILHFFCIRVFFHGHWRLTGQQGKGGIIFYSTLPLPSAHEHSDIYLQLCMWVDYHIFNRTACIYKIATWWDLHLNRITIWLIDDVTLVFVCLRDYLILASLLQLSGTGNRQIRTRVNYHPCITSEPTNQVLVTPKRYLETHFVTILHFKVEVK